MNVFSLLIERIGSSVQPYIGSLIEQIPRIWSETQGDNASMLHCVIISMLSHLVKSLGALSVQLHPFLVHIIRQATDIKQVSRWIMFLNKNFVVCLCACTMVIVPCYSLSY